MDVSSLARQHATISSLWDGSLEQHALLSTMQRKLRNIEILQIDSAMCLGLGSMERVRPSRVVSSGWSTEGITPEVPDSWESDISSDDEPNLTVEPHHRLGTTPINHILYQLVIFETAIEFLREEFVFKNIYFHDPIFSKADVAFLEQRGYKVIPYSVTPVKVDDTPIDPVMLEHMTPSTFLFTPGLLIPILAEVLCTKGPRLILSEDPLLMLGNPVLPCRLLEAYEELICPCNFANVAKLGYDHFGFTWPLVLDSERALVKFQSRQSKAEEKKCQRAEFIKKVRGAATHEHRTEGGGC